MSKSKIKQYTMLDGVPQAERLRDALEKLDMKETWDFLQEVNDRAMETKFTYFDFLENLLEQTFYLKEDCRQKRWVQQARLPANKRLEAFNFHEPNLQIDERLINELASCRFIDEAKNVFFTGPTGVGKTHLAIGVGHKGIEAGRSVKFLTLKELLEQIQRVVESGDNINNLLVTLTRPDLLIIDDVENLETSEEVSSFLLSLICERYEKKPIMFTTNESFYKFDKLFGPRRRAAKILDRLFHHQVMVKIHGDSYRVKDKLQF